MMKKRFSRVTALLLALMMTLAIVATSSTTALADYTIDASKEGKATLTLTKYYGDKNDGNTAGVDEVGYTLYLVGTLEQDTTATGTEVYYKDKNGAKIDVSSLNPDSYNTSNAISTVAEVKTNSAGKIEFTGLSLGLYLAVETTKPANVSSAKNFFVQVPQSTDSGWDYDVEAEPKNTATSFDGTLTKTFDDDSYSTSVNAGGTVNYKVTTTLPTGIEGYTQYDIIDTPSQYLTLSNFALVYSGSATLAEGTDYSFTDSGSGTYTVSFTAVGLAKLEAEETVTITYTATVALNAPINTELKNNVKIDYTDPTGTEGEKDPDPEDPDENPDPEDNPDIPVIYTYAYQFTKVGSDDVNTGLVGAEFVMEASAGSYYKWDTVNGWVTTTDIAEAYRFTSDGDGYVKFERFAAGTYTVTEVKAPSGYVLLTKTFTITISADSSKGTSTITVTNQKDGNTVLPETGGNGIYLFIVVGAALIVTAIALYVKSRKRNDAAQ